VLRALDPVVQKTAWEKKTSDGYSVWDGGVLSRRQSGVPGPRRRDLCVYTADRGHGDLRSTGRPTWTRDHLLG